MLGRLTLSCTAGDCESGDPEPWSALQLLQHKFRLAWGMDEQVLADAALPDGSPLAMEIPVWVGSVENGSTAYFKARLLQGL